MRDKQKQLTGKAKYWGRVDTSACTDGVAEVRRVEIEEIKRKNANKQLYCVLINYIIHI